MLTAKGRLVFTVLIMISTVAFCFMGLAHSAQNLRPNIHNFILHNNKLP